MADLEVSAQWDGQTCIIALRGEARLETVERFDTVAAEALERGADHLLVDMTHVSFMDSASTGSLLRLRIVTAERDTSLVLFGLQRVIRRLLEHTGLAEGFVRADDEAAARELL